MRRGVPALVIAGLLMLAAPALPHHSQTMYEEKKEVTFKGVITQFKWTNPHSWLHIDVTQPDGKVVNWAMEANAASNLKRAGWVRTQFPIGEQVTFTVRPRKDGTPEGLFIKVVLASGKEFALGGNGPQVPR